MRFIGRGSESADATDAIKRLDQQESDEQADKRPAGRSRDGPAETGRLVYRRRVDRAPPGRAAPDHHSWSAAVVWLRRVLGPPTGSKMPRSSTIRRWDLHGVYTTGRRYWSAQGHPVISSSPGRDSCICSRKSSRTPATPRGSVSGRRGRLGGAGGARQPSRAVGHLLHRLAPRRARGLHDEICRYPSSSRAAGARRGARLTASLDEPIAETRPRFRSADPRRRAWRAAGPTCTSTDRVSMNRS